MHSESLALDPVPLPCGQEIVSGTISYRRAFGIVHRMMKWEAARFFGFDLTARMPWGNITVNPRKDVGCTSTYVWRRASAPEVNALQNGVLKGDIAWDVGAHCGTLSRLMESRGAFVTAFEPDRETLPYLLKNSNGKNIHIVPYAMSDKIGNAVLTTWQGPKQNTVEAKHPHLHRDKKPIDETVVQRITGDSVDGWPDVVKIDVEGHEIAVLNGMRRKLPRVRLIIVECHNFHLADAVYQILKPSFRLKHYCPEQTEERSWIVGRNRVLD